MQHLREHCTGVTQECELATGSLLASLEALGDLHALDMQCQQLAHQAQERDDRHALAMAAGPIRTPWPQVGHGVATRSGV